LSHKKATEYFIVQIALFRKTDDDSFEFAVMNPDMTGGQLTVAE
jgi:hypothetical protein